MSGGCKGAIAYTDDEAGHGAATAQQDGHDLPEDVARTIYSSDAAAATAARIDPAVP